MYVVMWNQSEWFVLGLTSSTANILQYTNVTGANQSGSSGDSNRKCKTAHFQGSLLLL